ncbi:cold shock domain-containing protein [Streptomyces sp. 891-h]|uniref:cold-shock protein n=1 Tax=unclassified Streptomyces TaxID=2593676 RepID=UPI001FA9BCB4|nr:cold shock domain-containing protein [Streptomyces sp. 891-h]UNZ16323.1 cold shock domain-containing protein [Streptomyces sp. 891-h]
MVAGRVVRFDGARGYGFIAPDHGGEDVFLHANDLMMPESFVHTGVAVEFEIEDGDRGLKASSVRLLERPESPSFESPAALGGHASRRHPVSRHEDGDDGEDPMCDVLSVTEYTRAVTELLLEAAPGLTGAQILDIRRRLVQFGKSHGWAED